jgi:hypothetical protein
MGRGDIKRWKWLAVLTAVASTLACSSELNPSRACTLIGCDDGLTVELEPKSGWPAGTYQFTIDADATRVTCRGALPLASCANAPALTCDTTGVVSISESGCALAAAAQGFPQITFARALRPKRVVVAITRDDALVARAELLPEFKTSTPNGPGCPPTCTQARAQVTVRF